MTREERRQIELARSLLGLGERASLREIKKAFRAASKEHHPDMATEQQKGGGEQLPMHEIVAAYETLIAYCESYPVPLVAEEVEELDGEEWWLDRFGQDPLWGKGRP